MIGAMLYLIHLVHHPCSDPLEDWSNGQFQSTLRCLLPLEPFASDEGCEIGDAAGVAPLVVVPGEDLDHRATYDHRRETIDDRRMRIASQIGRDQWLLAVIQNTLKRAGGCCLKGVIYFVFGGLSPYGGHEVDDGDGDGGNTQGHAIEAAL